MKMKYPNGIVLRCLVVISCCSYFTTSSTVRLNLEYSDNSDDDQNDQIPDNNFTVTCQRPFEGFGVFMGSVRHFQRVPKGTVQSVFQQVYDDLGIRHFRTSYESEFSPSPHNYTISCATGDFSCTWIEVMDVVSQFPNISIFGSVWSPPHYMKNEAFDTLMEESEEDYHYFVRNITEIIKTRWGIQIERVSPVNEPENLFAPWEHTNMGPHQMCRMVKEFNDPLMSICPENSYYWMSELYSNYSDEVSGVTCRNLCDVYATHAYALNIDFFSPNHLLAYYDLGRYTRFTDKPIWMTEVSSTYGESATHHNQMLEAFDLASNIVHFVGDICVERYYFWFTFTSGSSGESLIWGYNPVTKQFRLPKKYFIFKHFTLAALGGSESVAECKIASDDSEDPDDNEEQLCLTFGGNGTSSVVLVNRGHSHYQLDGVKCLGTMCCTSSEFNWFCVTALDGENAILPKRSVCSCVIDGELPDERTPKGYYKIRANATIYSNHVY